MSEKNIPDIANLGSISDAINSFAEEKRAENENREEQYQAGKQRGLAVAAAYL